ncbi:aspartate 1-decarboxylase [Kineococcus indalonis]|uniref:aspartate 1-decarboxylase n=1 Tax=Kineococcus indalonis TaxID=2696566 RepID=UPI001411EFFC|nr:aspartate 1-decarboxylase [Kineococcus indalonis]NAZ87215.1 aspartate 1-decarboxylase [Kineococcus indalonis]
MRRTLMNGKIHRATVTEADLHYVGSITLDADLCRAADLVEGEKVQVVDVTNGARLETYVIVGGAGGGDVKVNGAAAHLVHPGDLVIIVSYVEVEEAERAAHRPRVVHVDARNRVVAVGDDPAQPVPGAPEQVPSR